MKTKYLKIGSIAAMALMLLFASCLKDLDTVPLDKDVVTAATVYKTLDGYTSVLAKVYASLATTGQKGPDGDGDVGGIDEGFSNYLRQYWYCQELTTDEAVIGWNDATIKDFHWQVWGASDVFITAMYYRIFQSIAYANEFIRESADSKLSDRGFSDADKTTIREMRAEARFMRALFYYHAIDLFGNVPFITEKDAVGAFLPDQISRADLFDYVESELLAIESDLPAPKTNQYGRADQAADWMLLATMYLNAEVYTGEARYTDCITTLKKVFAAGYTIDPEYSHLFLADNNNASGIIFPVTFDGINTRSWGGMTFIVHAAVGGSMNVADYGLDFGWGGTRTTKTFVAKFSDITGATDKRAMFYTSGQNLEINEIGTFTDGYAITKFKNKTSTGANGSNLTFVDNDFPMFRIEDAYLMAAEAFLRGGTGITEAEAVDYVNLVRERAYTVPADGDIDAGDLTLDFILDERARELYWEGHRRTDLIRYERFSESTYVWPWKGGVAAGASTDSHLNLFPLPSADVGANPKLKQNDGY